MGSRNLQVANLKSEKKSALGRRLPSVIIPRDLIEKPAATVYDLPWYFGIVVLMWCPKEIFTMSIAFVGESFRMNPLRINHSIYPE